MLERLEEKAGRSGAGKFGAEAPVYAFTTENLAAYLPFLGIDRGALLSVAGSGDHLINAALLGARSITAFDINIVARYWFDLKRAALALLSRDEFLEFLSPTPPHGGNALRYQTFIRLEGSLSAGTRDFFKRRYVETAYDGRSLRESALFHRRDFARPELSTYLGGECEYAEARAALNRIDISWIECGIHDLCASLPPRTRFKTILLSNLADYAADWCGGEGCALTHFVEQALKPVLRRLRRGGAACAAYLYDIDSPSPHGPIDDPVLRGRVFGGAGIRAVEHRFPGAVPLTTDAVLLIEDEEAYAAHL